MALSLSRLGMPLAPSTTQSHAARSSGFVGAEAFTSTTAWQQPGEGLSAFVVRKGTHGSNDRFASGQLNPFTGFMAATVRTNTTAKGTTHAHTLFIFPHYFFSITHFSFSFFG